MSETERPTERPHRPLRARYARGPSRDTSDNVQLKLTRYRADSVQVTAHCVGSLSFIMSQAAGLKGVRSGICSQGPRSTRSW